VSDPTRILKEAELTSVEVERILRVCGPHALLVGGQALATWAVYYGIQPVGELSQIVTMDADFIGSADIAKTLQRSLGQPWKVRIGTLDDIGPQIAKVYAVLAEGVKQVDFLSSIIGLETEIVRKRSAQLMLPDGTAIHLLHPLDVLESRLRNLDMLPAKRNPIGVAQSRLAVSVVRAFIEEHMNIAGDPRTVRQAVKRVEKIALDAQLSQTAFTHNVDVLSAIPVERIAYSRFHDEQWPRILKRLEHRRQKFAALQHRRKLNAERSSGRKV